MTKSRVLAWAVPAIAFSMAAALCFGIGYVTGNDVSPAPVPTVAGVAERYDDAMKKRLKEGTVFTPFPNLTSTSCYASPDHDSSDLCAQWRAALAAEESARWTRNAFWISVVGAILSALGLGFVLWSLRQTDTALSEAQNANRIARDSAETDVRPIIVFDGVELSVDFGPRELFIVPKWKNIGKFPAQPIASVTRRIYVDHVPQAADLVRLAQDVPHRADSNGIIPAGATRLGGVKKVGSYEIGCKDRHRDAPPEAAAFMDEAGMERFQSINFAILSFSMRYKSAIGPKTEWETEHLICIRPRWNADGTMVNNHFDFVSIRHLEEYRMT